MLVTSIRLNGKNNPLLFIVKAAFGRSFFYSSASSGGLYILHPSMYFFELLYFGSMGQIYKIFQLMLNVTFNLCST